MDDPSAVRAEFRRNVTEARSQIASMRASLVRHRDAIDQANSVLEDAWMTLGAGADFLSEANGALAEVSGAPPKMPDKI